MIDLFAWTRMQPDAQLISSSYWSYHPALLLLVFWLQSKFKNSNFIRLAALKLVGIGFWRHLTGNLFALGTHHGSLSRFWRLEIQRAVNLARGYKRRTPIKCRYVELEERVRPNSEVPTGWSLCQLNPTHQRSDLRSQYSVLSAVADSNAHQQGFFFFLWKTDCRVD